MRKISVCMLILYLLIFGSFYIISSAAPASDIVAQMDYLTNTINVKYTNSQNYDAYVAVYVTKSVSGGSAVLSDIVKMDKALCKSKQTVSFSFECDNSMLTDTYNIYAVLSGSQAVKSQVPGGVLVVSNAQRDTWLSDINSAPETAILPDLAVADMIYSKIGVQMGYTSPESWKNTYIFAIRRDDFANQFPDFSKITDAWADADKIYAMRQSVSSEALALLMDNDGESLGIDIGNDDYKNYKLEFAVVFKSMINSADSKSRDSIGKQFKKAAAVTAINKRDVDGKAAALTEYRDELRIGAIHQRIVTAGAVEVARLLDGFEATDIESVYPKVLSALEQVEGRDNPADSVPDTNLNDKNNNSYDGVRVPTGSGGGGGGGSSQKEDYIPVANPETKSFADISAHWAEKYIEELASDGVINGYEDGTFRAENVVSREELVKMIVKSFDLSGNSDTAFGDVADDFWAKEVIETAIACGITNGVSDTEFGVGIAVTRQDVAVMVDRALAYLKCDLTKGEITFNDSADIADYAKEAISKLAQAELLNGFEDGTFMPREALTRAQVAKILCLARELVK